MLGTTGVNSSTNVWAAVGKTYDLTSKWSVGAKAFVGSTVVNNSNSSVFRFNGPLVTTSMQATLTKKDTLFNNDALSLTVRPVNEVLAGSVDVTRVGSYTFTEVNGGEYSNATPTVETQRTKLGRFQDTQYTVSYSVMPSKNSKATINYSMAPGADSKLSARFTVLF
jgi:hypothetical protein